MAKYVKITVLKRLVMEDLIEKYSELPLPPCHRCENGQVFYTDGRQVPEGFCVWAWSDIFKDILMVRQGAKCLSSDGKCQIVSCTDGFRPVIFLLEPCEELPK